jgi:cyclin B
MEQEACGLKSKPKPPVEDIDKLDGDNELAVVDYIEDIYSYYKSAQVTTIFLPLQTACNVQLTPATVLISEHLLLLQHECRPVDYMGRQPEIDTNMRAILVDWLVEVAHKFELMPESFYLAIYIIDRFLSMQAVPRRELQLVGVAAMLIACKYEEIWAPEVRPPKPSSSPSVSLRSCAAYVHVCQPTLRI